MNRFMRRVLSAMLLGVLIYGAFVLYTGLEKIQESLARFHYGALLLALLLASANYLIRFAKWQYYLARLGVRGVGWFDSLLVFLSGFVLTSSYAASADRSRARSEGPVTVESRGPSPSTKTRSAPSACGTSRMSAKRIAASKPKRRIGCSVTSAASSGE